MQSFCNSGAFQCVWMYCFVKLNDHSKSQSWKACLSNESGSACCSHYSLWRTSVGHFYQATYIIPVIFIIILQCNSRGGQSGPKALCSSFLVQNDELCDVGWWSLWQFLWCKDRTWELNQCTVLCLIEIKEGANFSSAWNHFIRKVRIRAAMLIERKIRYGWGPWISSAISLWSRVVERMSCALKQIVETILRVLIVDESKQCSLSSYLASVATAQLKK